MNNVHAPFVARLDEAVEIAEDTKIFRFEISGPPKAAFLPGQFFLLQVEEKVFRSYSLAGSPSELPFFDLIIKYIPGGKASELLWSAKPGDAFPFRGPMGRFGLRCPDKKQLFIATGTGLAPFRSFWRSLLEQPDFCGIDLLFGVRHQKNLFCIEELEAIRVQYPDRFSYTVCLSQPETNASSKMPFQKGRVTDALRAMSNEKLADSEISLCGSRPMVEEIKTILHEKGVGKKGINVESW